MGSYLRGLAVLLFTVVIAGMANAQHLVSRPSQPATVVSRTAADQALAIALRAPARLDVEEVSLVQALEEIHQSASVPILFSPTLIPDVAVTCRCTDSSIAGALEELLRGTALEAVHLGGAVVIKEREDGGASAGALPLGDLPSPPVIGQVSGRVIDQATRGPLSTVQVIVEGTAIGGITSADGTFTLTNIPDGSYTVRAMRIGYQPVSRAGVVVGGGATTRVDFEMSIAVLTLQGVVATGLVDPVEGVRSPITVGQLNRQMMPAVSTGSAVQNLQGAVAGVAMNRRSGQPGQDVSIMLRTPTSVTGSGQPMIVVDGVILGSGATDIESLDIESMEVIRGAAAASLYGSRAASGVISITTNRGRGLDMGATRFTARTEMGVSGTVDLPKLPTHHQFLMSADGSTYVDANGNPVNRSNRVAPAAHLAFMDKPYPGPVYDNVRNAFQGGAFNSQNLSVMQNALGTNFAITLNRLREQGPLINNDGYERTSFRTNLDHRIGETVNLGVSAYHSRDRLDVVNASFVNLLRAPADVDITRRDENGDYVRVPDPTVNYENPLWFEGSRDNERNRARTLASGNVRWEPVSWLSFSSSVSYDRQDGTTRFYLPKGTPLSVTQDLPSDGQISFQTLVNDTWNGEAQTTARRDFGVLNARATLRGLVEYAKNEQTSASGTNFFVQGVPRIDATANRNSASSVDEIRALGYLLDTAFDYSGKYIATLLVRRDGSSLFGEDNRWHTYYRAAGAYRLSEEQWFNLPYVDEFKLSFARGTAGGRPVFEAQYETWVANASGISKGALGNRDLRPEHTTEQEVSIESILAGRIGITGTYAWQRTEGQLVQAPLPGFTGYANRWTNAGTVEGNTIELTVQAQVLDNGAFNWNTNFVFDRSRAKITDWPIPCQSPLYNRWCQGVSMYDLYSSRFLESPGELEGHHGGSAAARSAEFQVNDEGFLVWVGAGNTYQDGIAKNLWGTQTSINGLTYNWGMPIFRTDETGLVLRERIGDASTLNFGWSNSIRYRQFQLGVQMHAVVGGDIVNQDYFRALLLTEREAGMDQFGKPEGLKKPVAYYHAIEGGRGNSAHIDSGDYLKLRSASLEYRFNQDRLTRLGLDRFGMEAATISVVGRNLLTVTGCRCPDPELGRNLNDRTGSLSGLASYPTTRTLTAAVEVTF